ncbi:hypothetical protein GDO81_026161 [Engystomops pustulosus]|uniref:Uncharacterized protein n=1 Tax=Engystomops pustulosus TaxID=76066 RepID=A0AAV6YLK0_ENGPU|nr:hypothetical protein GDO81_026161 [Engystomops pustulosus]
MILTHVRYNVIRLRIIHWGQGACTSSLPYVSFPLPIAEPLTRCRWNAVNCYHGDASCDPRVRWAGLGPGDASHVGHPVGGGATGRVRKCTANHGYTWQRE